MATKQIKNHLTEVRRVFRSMSAVPLFRAISLSVMLATSGLVQAQSTIVFSANFNAGVPPEFSGITTTEGVRGYAGIGTGANVFGGKFLRNQTVNPTSKTVLTLTGLPSHTSVDINFLLAIIYSWDGNSGGADPDVLNVTVDGKLIFSETFTNFPESHTASYPNPTTPLGVILAQQRSLGFSSIDSAYDMGLDPAFNNIPHTASTLTIEWFASGAGWQGGIDESWAIDNVEIRLPGPPNATAVSSTAVLLSWDNNLSGEKGFRIQSKDGACNSDNLWVTLTDISADSDADLAKFLDQPLLPDTQYSYRVSSYYGSGTFGAYSPCASAITAAAGTPHVPINLRAYSRSNNQVNLTWNDASETETSFNIYRRAGTGELTLLATVPEGAQIFKDTTANGNYAATSYQYNIRACNASGCSRLLKPSEVPFKPGNFSVTVGTAVKLTWKDSSNNESGFEIWRKNGDCASESPWARLGSVAASTRVFNDSNAVPATQYAYEVRAYYDNGALPKTWGFSHFTRCVSATAP